MRWQFATVLAVIVAAAALGVSVWRTQAQPYAPMPMPRGTMSGPMIQMQQHMSQMDTSLGQMRAELDKVNPGLLTPSERAMYEYLRLLPAHMESMRGWMGSAQGTMRRMMPAPRR